MSEKQGVVSRVVGGCWRTLDVTRKVVVNLVALALVVALIVIALHGGKPEVPRRTALVLAPRGPVVEQLAGDPVDRALGELTGRAEPETLLRDLIDAIRIAADDKRVEVLVLELSDMGGAGETKLEDLGEAIAAFKQAGKRVVAYADLYGQAAYYLASLADEVILHEQGMVLIDGFGRFRTYYREGLDRLGVEVHVFRVGEYKSAVEPFLRDGMSDEAKQANLDWLGDLWRSWVADVAANRGLEQGELLDAVERFGERIEAAGGRASKAALDSGLVDRVGPRDALRERLVELVGEDEKSHSFHQVACADYLEAMADERPGAAAKGDAVGVVVAKGTILDGSQPPGAIGGDSTAALVRRARHDDDVKAVVLRVDSGGGSGFASEVIRRELELTREAGKPVVASMGSVAASGGYWITLASDEVWASETTITGSIGVFGLFPTFEKPLARYLGVHVDGVGTTPLSGAVRLDRALPDEVGEVIQQMVDDSYREFITKVAAARGKTPEEIDAIARGRVWSGEDALRLGLVDKIGGLDEAIAAAAALAELGDDYSVRLIEKEKSFSQRLVLDLLASARAAGLTGGPASLTSGPLDATVRSLAGPARALAELNDPRGVYAYCPVEVD